MEVFPTAALSQDRKYRYCLARLLGPVGPGSKTVNFIMLNPSTADEMVDDPTIRKLKSYATQWVYVQIVVTNLFAFRTALPNILYKAKYPVSEPEDPTRNDTWTWLVAQRSDLVILGWGNHGTWQHRDQFVVRMLLARDVLPYVLRKNKDGSPAHPLYLPLDLEPRPYADS